MNTKKLLVIGLCLALLSTLVVGTAFAKAKVVQPTYVVAPCLPGLAGYPVYVTPQNQVVARVHGNGWVYAPSVAYVNQSVALGYTVAPQTVVCPQQVVYQQYTPTVVYPNYPQYPQTYVYGYPTYAPATLPVYPVTVVK